MKKIDPNSEIAKKLEGKRSLKQAIDEGLRNGKSVSEISKELGITFVDPLKLEKTQISISDMSYEEIQKVFGKIGRGEDAIGVFEEHKEEKKKKEKVKKTVLEIMKTKLKYKR